MNQPFSSPTKNKYLDLNKFNFRSSPASNLDKLLNSNFQIKSLEISDHGKTGVIFIQTNYGSFVVKSSNQGPKDLFFNQIAKFFDINVPQVICYCCSDPLFHKLAFQIQKFCEKDQPLYRRLKARLDFPFYQVIQYIPYVAFAELGSERFIKYMIQKQKLIMLGKCIGFDSIINNNDRMKFIWSSQGNMNNILVKVQNHDKYLWKDIKNRDNTNIALGQYFFIDHSGFLNNLSVQMIRNNFQITMNKLKNGLINLIKFTSNKEQSSHEIPQQMVKLSKQFSLYTQYTFTKKQLEYISFGIIFSINNFLSLYQRGTIQEMYEKMKKPIPDKQIKTKRQKQKYYWEEYWNNQLNQLHLSYLQQVYNKIGAIFATYQTDVQYILDTLETIIPTKSNIEQDEPQKTVGKFSIRSQSNLKNRTVSQASKQKLNTIQRQQQKQQQQNNKQIKPVEKQQQQSANKQQKSNKECSIEKQSQEQQSISKNQQEKNNNQYEINNEKNIKRQKKQLVKQVRDQLRNKQKNRSWKDKLNKYKQSMK